MRRLDRLKAPSGSIHDVLSIGWDCERPVFRTVILCPGSFDHESPIEALFRPQLFLADLVTHGAGHAILRRGRFFVVRIER